MSQFSEIMHHGSPKQTVPTVPRLDGISKTKLITLFFLQSYEIIKNVSAHKYRQIIKIMLFKIPKIDKYPVTTQSLISRVMISKG